jgi:hypothetical protein
MLPTTNERKGPTLMIVIYWIPKNVEITLYGCPQKSYVFQPKLAEAHDPASGRSLATIETPIRLLEL